MTVLNASVSFHFSLFTRSFFYLAMATRSRRSAAGSDTLNPAMIHLYDVGRLKKELQQRGLETTGTRNILADRLQVNGIFSFFFSSIKGTNAS